MTGDWLYHMESDTFVHPDTGVVIAGEDMPDEIVRDPSRDELTLGQLLTHNNPWPLSQTEPRMEVVE